MKIDDPTKLFSVLVTYSSGAIYYMWVTHTDQIDQKAKQWKDLKYTWKRL